MTRPDLDALVKWARSKIGHYPAGSVEWHNNVQLLADALERLAREIADESARHEFTANRMKHEADCRDRAEAERDALREVVRAADAVRTLQFDDLWEVREYDRARAAWKDEV